MVMPITVASLGLGAGVGAASYVQARQQHRAHKEYREVMGTAIRRSADVQQRQLQQQAALERRNVANQARLIQSRIRVAAG